VVASIAAAAAAAAASSVGVKPQAEAPHSAPVAPRNALRRRLRRRTCTARARTQRHRFVLRARAGQSLRVRAQLLRSARASRRAAKGARRSMANVEMVGSSAVRRRAWSQSQRGAEARIGKGKKVGRTDELKGARASTLKGCCARLFQGPQDYYVNSTLKQSRKAMVQKAHQLGTGQPLWLPGSARDRTQVQEAKHARRRAMEDRRKASHARGAAAVTPVLAAAAALAAAEAVPRQRMPGESGPAYRRPSRGEEPDWPGQPEGARASAREPLGTLWW